jgi:hypothetical protein
MQPDDPTVPIVGWQAPEPGTTPGESATFADFPMRSAVPTWPGAAARPHWDGAPRQVPRGSVSATAFGISLGANVVLLIALASVMTFVLSHASSFLPGGGSGQSASGLAQGTATATASPAASPTPSAGWLRLAPSTVQLGCGDGQQTQVVVLQNTGQDSLRWQATFSLSADQAGVSVNPQRGTLSAGASVAVQLQNTTHASDTQGASGPQGVITFAPRSSDAGPPATLTYTTVGCS